MRHTFTNHLVDWYLTAQDNDWCDPLTFSSSRDATRDTGTAASTSNSLTESGSSPIGTQIHSMQYPHATSSLARHSSASLWNQDYATRLSMPANHKLEAQLQAAQLVPSDPSTNAYLDEQQVAINEQLQHQQSINRIELLSSNKTNALEINQSSNNIDLTNGITINDLTRKPVGGDNLSRKA